MRICTITCQNADNYGARLQAYALAEYLRRQGHDVEVIDYRPSYMIFGVKKWYFPKSSIKEWAKLFLRLRQRATAIRRHEVFQRFSAQHLPLTRIYSDITDLRGNPPQADLYIAGSDQIWNTLFKNGTDAAYYLDFGDDSTRRISYAASFATKSIPQNKIHFVKEHLQRFDSISVRETSGLHLLSDLGQTGKQVVDPVFLLSVVDWDKLLPVGSFAEDYVLVYDFLRSKAIRNIAKRLSSLMGCKIYSVCPYRSGYADRNFVYASPERFVSLIKHSCCVVSNSFHGTALAMIYKRNFFVVNREDGLNERMADLLERYGLRCRLIAADVSDEALTSNVDYREVASAIVKDVSSSKAYLRSCCSC